MNECFTDPIFGNFSVERKKKTREGVWKRKEKKLRERLVSYSVSTVMCKYTFKLLKNTI